MGIPIIGAIVDKVMGVVDKAVTDKDAREQIRAAMMSEFVEYEKTLVEQASANVRAEMGGQSWLQRNWRPLAMLDFLGLINAYWFGYMPPNVTEDIILTLFNMVTVGLTGYVAGRSAEKIAGAVAPAIRDWGKKKG